MCEAYRYLREKTEFSGATLEVAGYLAPEHKPYLKKVESQMKDWGLGQEFQYRGVLDRAQKVDFLRSLNVLSVPSSYNEPKGIYLLEAMANGIPVVQPRRGAFPEILGKTGGGILVEADDIDQPRRWHSHVFGKIGRRPRSWDAGARRVSGSTTASPGWRIARSKYSAN